ncbi:MAG: T9SS type A sorting domain-containing protein [Bacteroidota bacterium]
MKTLLLFVGLFFTLIMQAQITTPTIKAGFGVDAELRANFFNGFVQSGNDDWFKNGTPGTGRMVIDTTGAAAIVAGYLSDVSPFPRRSASIYRPMSVPQFSVINNRLWLDALWVRDYHGNDTTVFTAGADKNGMSPQLWSGGVQGIPDKNDILDIFVHVRRAGPTTTDSLWLFGGISLDNTTGNRYFDFEMYQTDINYDRTSGQWFGFGADAGHTSWQFDAAGNITRPGDIIFSAEYQSSSLTNIEARIWIDKASLSLTPVAFNWSGQFDGASSGAQFGYASILPNTAGAFYTGLGSGPNTYAGPFQAVLQNNALVANYARDQFMEFSVNLSKLGLDPVTLLGGDICGSPFNRVVVKTRASASFTSELKDFVAPTDLFLAPRVDVAADVPIFCGVIGVSTIRVQNPSSSSVYTWTTPNGHIYGSSTGQQIQADSAGTYIVTQQLAAGCNPYAYDTITITFDASCTPLENTLTHFSGFIAGNQAKLHWTITASNTVEYFEVQRSTDATSFSVVGTVASTATNAGSMNYSFSESIEQLSSELVFYRLKIKRQSGEVAYSKVVRLNPLQKQKDIIVYPNPADQFLQIGLPGIAKGTVTLTAVDASGVLVFTQKQLVKEDNGIMYLNVSNWKTGLYFLQLQTAKGTTRKKLIVTHINEIKQ